MQCLSITRSASQLSRSPAPTMACVRAFISPRSSFRVEQADMKAARCTSEYFPDAISEMILSKASAPSRLPVIRWRTSDRDGSVGAWAMPRSAPGTAPSRFQAASESPASERGSQSSSIWCSVAITDLVPQVTRILERDVRPSARQTGQSVRMRTMASSWVCHFRRRAFRGWPPGT